MRGGGLGGRSGASVFSLDLGPGDIGCTTRTTPSTRQRLSNNPANPPSLTPACTSARFASALPSVLALSLYHFRRPHIASHHSPCNSLHSLVARDPPVFSFRNARQTRSGAPPSSLPSRSPLASLACCCRVRRCCCDWLPYCATERWL